MANLILPRRFTQQPQYSVELDENHFAYSAIIHAVSFNNLSPIDAKTKANLTIIGAPTASVILGGKAYSNTSSANRFSIPDSVANSPTKVIVVSGVSVNAAASDSIILCKNFASSSIPYMQYGRFAGIGANAGFAFYNGGWRHASGSDIRGTGYRVLVGDYNGTVINSYLDGRLNASTTYGPTSLPDNASSIDFGAYVNDGIGLNGSCAFTFILDGTKIEPSAYLAKELSANPWQIFKRTPQVLYFDVGGGGATGSGALTTTAVTASGSGVISHTGTGALSTNVATASGTGVLSHTGTGALTTLVATLAGAGVLTHVGTGALTTSATTLSGDGTVSAAGTVTGTGALTTTAVTASGSGVLSHTGTGSLSTSVVTLDGSGVLTHTGTGALTTGAITADGTGQILTTITGTGALTTNKVTVYGYDVLPVTVLRSAGGSSVSVKPAKRQKLIIVEQIDDVEELVEQVQEIIKTEPRKKLANKVKKPTVSLQESPQAAFDWIGYYQAQLDALRDQQRAEALKRQLENNAQVLRAIVEMQAKNAILAEQEAEYARLREEEDFLLLLMAA